LSVGAKKLEASLKAPELRRPGERCGGARHGHAQPAPGPRNPCTPNHHHVWLPRLTPPSPSHSLALQPGRHPEPPVEALPVPAAVPFLPDFLHPIFFIRFSSSARLSSPLRAAAASKINAPARTTVWRLTSLALNGRRGGAGARGTRRTARRLALRRGLRRALAMVLAVCLAFWPTQLLLHSHTTHGSGRSCGI
jgi:hypothetical protein